MEFDRMLDDFSPWFVEWWGTGVLPVDADFLPPLQFLITEHLLGFFLPKCIRDSPMTSTQRC
jgi:hypothetical protein